MKANQINDEIEIRCNTHEKDILSAIAGRFTNKITKDRDIYSYDNGVEFEDSEFKLNFKIEESQKGYNLLIKRTSNYHFYFQEDYHLHIEDSEDFIEWCNKLPPFMFVVFLYRANVSIYSRNSLDSKLQD